MPRNLIAALFLLPAILWLGLGTIMAAWIALALYNARLAFDWALWAVKHSGLPLRVPPEQFANDMIQRNYLIGEGLIAAFLLASGVRSLRVALAALRPVDMSDDGKAQITPEQKHPMKEKP